MIYISILLTLIAIVQIAALVLAVLARRDFKRIMSPAVGEPKVIRAKRSGPFIFWVSWAIPRDVTPLERYKIEWPDDMRGWCTGASQESGYYVGIIKAKDAKGAAARVRSCYPSDAGVIMRGEPSDMTERTEEISDRFPGATEFMRQLQRSIR